MNELGRFGIILGFLLSAWSLGTGLYGARTRRPEWVRSAEAGLKVACVSLTVSAVALWYAFLTRDFSLEYVASYSDRSLSLFYTLGAFWAGQPGSLLLWSWVLALYAAILVIRNRSRHRELMTWAVPTLAAVLLLFTFLAAFPSNPFKSMPFTPPDGQGLNPLLLNYGQWLHPLTLYMGYVGFTIPFAFCVAALVTGRLNETWIRIVRKWTLWAWFFLTAGILFGARWAYVELGWGGYWAWDPVENASLLPWLTGTAYLHSVMIQERKGMLKVWNVSLAVATFALSVLGTFLTRSGVISSVHAFAQSNVGPFLMLAAIGVVIGGGLLIMRRLPDLRSSAVMESWLSREASFLLNNLLLVAIAFAVFWGTIFPLVAEAARGVKVSVGPPFYEQVVTPMGVVLLAVLGACPLIAWRKATGRNVRRNFVLPASVGAATYVVSGVLSGRYRGLALVLALCAFVTATVALEFIRGARARTRARGERWPTALGRLVSRNPRRYGGYLIHLGVIVMLTGVAFHVAYQQEFRAELKIGESAEVGRYRIELEDVTTEQSTAKFSTFADLKVFENNKQVGTMRTEEAIYANREQPMAEVGIRSTAREDLFVIQEAADPRAGTARFRMLVNPALFWIWVGATVVLVGGVVVGWPERRKKREVVTGAQDAPELVTAATSV